MRTAWRGATVCGMSKLTERRTTNLSESEAADLAWMAKLDQRSEAWLLRRAWLAYSQTGNRPSIERTDDGDTTAK